MDVSLDNKHNIIREIVMDLECGYDCFYNPKNDAIISIPSTNQFIVDDDFRDSFSESLEQIATHKADLIEIRALESFESFQIMELYVEQMPDLKLKASLENALANRKPFKNFSHLIDHSAYRQDWFDFKQQQLEKYVIEQLRNHKN